MIPILFSLSVAFLFTFILFLERGERDAVPGVHNVGLLKWLAGGNWPAKIGALLLILGFGALLRYTLINLDFPPQHKLISGFVISTALAVASTALRGRAERRAIHLALAGAAFGVAYLTAYSAYGFFNYINSINALSLLAIVAACAGYFSVTSNAISIGILAMAGAYVAPAFAIGNPDPVSIYGYYLATSLVSTLMVSLRGWRPLIHLSFLFTLAGALFFGWSSKFYQPQYFQTMLPMLLGLTLVHVFMPIIEQSGRRATWLLRFDLGYFVLLPVVSAGLMLQIAPDIYYDGALGLCGLALTWAIAALYLKLLKQDGAARHVVVALLLVVGAGLCRLQSIPWNLLAIAVLVVLLALTPKLGWKKQSEEIVCGAILFLALMHVSASIIEPTPTAIFFNSLFAKRLIGAALIGSAGLIARRRQIGLATILVIVAMIWAALASITELLRLHWQILPQLAYGLVLTAVLALAANTQRWTLRDPWVAIVSLSLLVPSVWAALTAERAIALGFLIMTPLILLYWARQIHLLADDRQKDNSILVILGALPVLMAPWTVRTGESWHIDGDLFFLVPIILGMLLISFWSPRCFAQGARELATLRNLHFYAAALVITLLTLFNIDRNVWAMLFEVLTLLFLAKSTAASTHADDSYASHGAISVICFALVLQAMLLRWFGPAKHVLTIADIGAMALPSLVSLIWVIFGAALTWWAMRSKSRSIWSAGALLLVLAAVKLVLFDFGALGQLGNILAMIAAGLVFMGVAWFAPMPPTQAEVEGKSTTNK